jgi:lysozyme
MDIQFVQNLLMRHEGYRSTCYRDSRGFLTIGIGFNLDDLSAEETCQALGLNYSGLRAGYAITLLQAQAVANRKISACLTAAQFQFPNWDDIPENAQAVVIDMLFNLGATKFSEFKLMIAALRSSDYPEAAAQMRQSLWFKQVGQRGLDDVALMEAE